MPARTLSALREPKTFSKSEYFSDIIALVYIWYRVVLLWMLQGMFRYFSMSMESFLYIYMDVSFSFLLVSFSLWDIHGFSFMNLQFTV